MSISWEIRAKNHLIILDKRIKELKGKPYPGYGFHYAKEQELKKIHRLLSEYGNDWVKDLITKVCLESLTKSVVEAESYLEIPV